MKEGELQNVRARSGLCRWRDVFARARPALSINVDPLGQSHFHAGMFDRSAAFALKEVPTAGVSAAVIEHVASGMTICARR
ncbi:MAG: hypothetical protein ACREP7_05475 [Lysobacter sp.]